MTKISILLIMATIITIILSSQITVNAQEENPDTTPDNEYEIWKSLKKKIIDNEKQLPFPVTDVLKSLDQDILINFDCKDSKEDITKVKIKIRTSFARWDNSNPNAAGLYLWDETDDSTKKEGDDIVRYINVNNELMINPSKIGDENSDLRRWNNEATFYHELLHGQLLINAMNTAEWRKKACDGDFDESPTNGKVPHDIIYDFENKYLDTLIDKNGYKIVEKEIGFLVIDNEFTVRVNLEEDLKNAGKMGGQMVVTPGTSNIEIYNFGRVSGEIDRITEINGKITGEKPSEGKIFLREDPANTIIKYIIWISYADDHPPIIPGKKCENYCHGEKTEYKIITGYNLNIIGIIILSISLVTIGLMRLKRKN